MNRILGALFLGVTLGAACGWPQASPCPTCGSDYGGPQDPTLADLEQYADLTARLEANRTSFVTKKFINQTAVGNKLFYYDSAAWAPVLLRYDGERRQTLRYGFSVGDSLQDANWRASDVYVVTAARDAGKAIYRVYDASQPEALVAEVELPQPGGEQKWWAYAVSGGTLYVVALDAETSSTWLHRWTAGGQIERLFTLEEATRQSALGEFLDFDVDGDTMLFIEGQRLWHMKLGEERATWTRNPTQISGPVNFQDDRVLWAGATGLFSYAVDTDTLTKLSDTLSQCPYQLNSTYRTAHLYQTDEGDFTRWGNWVVYKASAGIFAYDLRDGSIRPVLLDSHTDRLRIVYRHLAVLACGEMFVRHRARVGEWLDGSRRTDLEGRSHPGLGVRALGGTVPQRSGAARVWEPSRQRGDSSRPDDGLAAELTPACVPTGGQANEESQCARPCACLLAL